MDDIILASTVLQTFSKVMWTAIVILMTFGIIFGIFTIAISTKNIASARSPQERSEAMKGLFNAIICIGLASAVPLVFRLIVELINMVSA